jgi:cysteine desulfurase / selenocysteine lyase
MSVLFGKKTVVQDDFPLLKAQGIAYLDNASTTQKPAVVLQAMQNYYEQSNANVHRGLYKLAEQSTQAYEDARKVIAKLLHAKEEEVIFTSGATHALNLAAHIVEQHVQPGDEIIVTVADHHSTFVPFQQLAKRREAKLVVVHLIDNGITEDTINKHVTAKTKVIATAAMSNVLGYSLDTSKIRKQQALLVIDAAQSIRHTFAYPNADFVAFSGHKVYGPMGTGVLWGKKALLQNADPLLYGGSMIYEVDEQQSTWAELPARFEAGTPNVAGAVGLAAALQYCNEHRSEAEKIEKELTEKAVAIIKKYGTLYGPVRRTAPVISFNLPNVHGHDVSQILDGFGVCVRAGQHCCEPLHDQLMVPATVRVSLALYNTEADLQKLEEGLQQVRKVFG